MSDNNPYSAPDADLAVESTGSSIDKVKQFPRFTTWAVVGLTMITLGIYAFYWLYSRTKMLNNLLPENKVAAWLPIGTLVAYVIYFLLSFAPLVMGSPDLMAATAGLSAVFSIVYMVLFIIWVYAFRNRLNILSGSNKGDMFWLGGILTFFINVYYFQYKINQMHDHG